MRRTGNNSELPATCRAAWGAGGITYFAADIGFPSTIWRTLRPDGRRIASMRKAAGTGIFVRFGPYFCARDRDRGGRICLKLNGRGPRCLRLVLADELQPVECRVAAAAAQQFLVTAAFGDHAVLHHHDAIGMHDG